ncbi:MAG: hypothetical protein ACXWO3_10450 [Isosphaeraceae bacterium]
MPFQYSSLTSAVQAIFISGSPTGGSFTLTTASPLPTNTTVPIPWNASADVVQAALGAIVGPTNVTVTGGPAPNTDLIITFQNNHAQQTIPPLVATNNLTGGTAPGISVFTLDPGGTVLPNSSVTYIQSIPNTTNALQGNNAEERVIIDGSHIPAASAATGFVLDASHCLLRGLIISGFNVGVSVSALDTNHNPVVGDLIQGNSIGDYYTYPVDTDTGAALPSPDNVEFVRAGNSQQGVVLNSSNTTVGGSNPQENNIICGNGAQGILVQPGASGNQILDSGQPDRHGRADHQRPVRAGRQWRRRSSDRVHGQPGESAGNRLCVEQLRRIGHGWQHDLGQHRRRRAPCGRRGEP